MKVVASFERGVYLREVEVRKRPEADVGGGEPRVDLNGEVERPVHRVAEHQVEAHIAEQPRHAVHGSPSEPHGALFRAYWIHGRNPRDTAASLGLGWDTAKALLGEAKEQVWRMLPEGGPA